jgi:hypothetical protein
MQELRASLIRPTGGGPALFVHAKARRREESEGFTTTIASLPATAAQNIDPPPAERHWNHGPFAPSRLRVNNSAAMKGATE